MAVTMTINGNSESWLTSTLKIDDNINARSTASFTVDTDNAIEVGQEVIILDDATRIFAGTIDSFTRTTPKGTTIKRYNITCVDYNQLGDRRIVAESYEDQTVSYIVNDLITKYLSAEGVSAGTIQTGPTMAQVVFNYITVTDCLNYIKDATGLNWNIDYNKQLHIFYREDNTDTGFSDADNNFMDAEVEETREGYRNRQYVRAGQDTTDIISLEKPTPKPDGISRKFSVRYPLATEPEIYINSTQVSSSDIGINGVEQNKKWYWNKGSKDIVQDNSETVLSDTDVLEVTYQGLVPIIAQADNPEGQADRSSTEGGTGVYEDIEQVASIDKKDAALDYAKGLLKKYADIPQRVNIRTRTFKQAGKLIPIDISKLGLDGEYLIESVAITEQQGVFFYDITCLSGESLGSWVEFFRKMRSDSKDFVIRENEVLVLLTTTSEATSWTEATSQAVYACPVPADPLYPADDLYPC